MWTTHDPGSTVEVGRQLAGYIPGRRFVVMDDCGHWPRFEDAGTFNRLQLEFLGVQAGRTGPGRARNPRELSGFRGICHAGISCRGSL